jgi:SAM-dependent methyltransferase
MYQSTAENITDTHEIERDPFFAMDLAQMAKATNYMAWQFQLIKPYLGRSILEIGGGIGNFTPRLADCAEQVASIEPNQHCYAKLKEETANLKNVTVHNTSAEDLGSHIPAGYRADTVVCMNVLEHLRDDEFAVAVITRFLRDGGNLVLLIPAVPWIFGDIDRKLGHYRRYTKQSAFALLAATGLKPVSLRYFNFIGVWGWWWNARVAKSVKQSDFQIMVFDKFIVPVASRLEPFVPLPLGQSLLVVAAK